MKKLSIVIAGFAVLLMSSSAFVDKRRDAAIGAEVPSLVVNNADSVLSLESLKGKWVVLSFWSASDAVSRFAQGEVSRFARELKGSSKAESVEIVSVNFDRSEQLMNEIVRLDNFSGVMQFHVSDKSEKDELRNVFRMKEGLRTFIINPEGVLAEADPSYESLCAITV